MKKRAVEKESKWLSDLAKDAKWIDAHLCNLEKSVMKLCKLMVKVAKQREKEAKK